MSGPQAPSKLTAGHKDAAWYFKGLSNAYARQTGNASYNVVHQFLSKLPPVVLSKAAVIHDNACGPGTASLAILSIFDDDKIGPERIDATDTSKPMIDQLEAQVSEHSLSNVHPAVEDSHSLPFPDNTFTLSITNIGVTNFSDPPKALREIHRTIKADNEGLAVVSIWKRFAVADVIHNAQRKIKGEDAELMPVPQQEYFEDGYLRDKMLAVGFKDVQQTVEITNITGEALQGLRAFMISDLTKVARIGYTNKEEARWESAIDEALKEATAETGGLVMEAWFVTGRK